MKCCGIAWCRIMGIVAQDKYVFCGWQTYCVMNGVSLRGLVEPKGNVTCRRSIALGDSDHVLMGSAMYIGRFHPPPYTTRLLLLILLLLLTYLLTYSMEQSPS